MPRPSKANPPPIPPLPIGKCIARARKAKGLTQEQLAESMGISRKQIADYEAERTHMNDTMVVRFALALGVSADELLGLAEMERVPASAPLRLTRRLQDLDKLPEQKKKKILNTLDDLIRANS